MMSVCIMVAKPEHLSAAYAAQFQQSDIAQAYHARPPYPPELFDLLASLVPRAARILELGAGTGDLTFGLAERGDSLDAVEPSIAMLEVARTRGHARSIAWHNASAEQFTFAGPYDLVVAAESLHWMDWHLVLPRIAHALTAEGLLGIVAERKLNVPWSAELREVIARFSTNRDYRAYDLIELLVQENLFREHGRRTLRSRFAQDSGDYVESFHSRNGFSRERMGATAARNFDAAVRGILAQHGANARVEAELAIEVIWGQPLGFEQR